MLASQCSNAERMSFTTRLLLFSISLTFTSSVPFFCNSSVITQHLRIFFTFFHPEWMIPSAVPFACVITIRFRRFKPFSQQHIRYSMQCCSTFSYLSFTHLLYFPAPVNTCDLSFPFLLSCYGICIGATCHSPDTVLHAYSSDQLVTFSLFHLPPIQHCPYHQ